MPPLENDELISSWLNRTAGFYGLPLAALLRAAGDGRTPVLPAAVDFGTQQRALGALATMLGMNVAGLMARTIGATQPNAASTVAGTAGSRMTGPRLHYAACPHCLEQQRIERGVSWLCRAWVLASRTVCSIHHAPLVAVVPGSPAHPLWSEFYRPYQAAAVRPGRERQIPAALHSPLADRAIALLHKEMAVVQDVMLTEVAGQDGKSPSSWKGRAAIVRDLAWAFTRADHREPDRLVYEAFSSTVLDNPWHLRRRRRPGPVEFATLPLEERHLLLATATAMSGTSELRERICPPLGHWTSDLASLPQRLCEADRREWCMRRRAWPTAE
ncbi:TniQ family protein (plasmid) [Roseomonas sp. CCTCC AB2023176]|uniref:TniQ family protein n=1 Tax=Roseomonas sp. CCTCC AB2023176 TaxID=3342640 RepID=UPI0035E1A1BB